MTMIRRTFTLLAAVVVSIPLVVAPVAAATGVFPAWACGPGATAAHAAAAASEPRALWS